MFKKLAIYTGWIVGFSMITSFAFAQEPSLPTADELLQQIQALRQQLSEIKKTADEAREIAFDSRTEAEKFQQETLYRLGVWREKLGEGMMMSIAAQHAAERAEKLVSTASQQVKVVLERVGQMEEKISLLSEQISEEKNARIKLESRLGNLEENVDALKADVMLAKEMAAGAKAQADEAIKNLEKKVNMLAENVSGLSENVDALKADVMLAKEMAAGAKAQADEAIKRLERNISVLSENVDALKADVMLAKEMAAGAKAQADEARKEVRKLAGEVRKNRELFLSKIEKILEEVKVKEEKIKTEKLELKAPAPSYGKIYTVKKGDSLWSIAADFYNNPTKWKKIFEANKDRLPAPDLLYPGLKLVIPEN